MDKFDAMTALGLIDDEGATWALMVPTMMHRIMALKPSARACHDLSRWAKVVHTAAPMAPWLKQAWIEWCGRDHIREVYGATEGLVSCWIRSEEHTSELQSLMSISYAVVCLKTKNNKYNITINQ